MPEVFKYINHLHRNSITPTFRSSTCLFLSLRLMEMKTTITGEATIDYLNVDYKSLNNKISYHNGIIITLYVQLSVKPSSGILKP